VLDWHRACTPQHRSDLSRFRCTTPGEAEVDDDTGEEHHDYPWELEVQRHVRGLHVPYTPPSFLLLGYDGDYLVAVLELVVYPLDDLCFIATVAVAHDRSGNGYAGEAIDRVANVMTTYYNCRSYFVEALIDPDNWAAKSVFAGRGYEPREIRNRYESWSRGFGIDEKTGP
jgi:hypothetical protein